MKENKSFDKLISIIVPVYNVEQYLNRCMNSIINQTYTNLEIILVDDGAKDSSGKMCDEWATKDNRIKVVHKENGGLSDARNAGLKVATGDYIGYVDSDDWIDTNMYEEMLTASIKNDADVIICRYYEEYQDRTISGGDGKQIVFDKEELLKAYIEDNDDVIIYNSVWSKLFKRSLVEGTEFSIGRNSEDIMYTTKAFCKSNKGVYIDSPFYHYVQDREGSIMNDKQADRMFKDEIPFWREHIGCISEMVSKDLGDYAAYYFYRRLLSYFIDISEYNKENAKKIANIIKNDRTEVKRVYSAQCSKKGDKVRMNIFLLSPAFYKMVNKLDLIIRG